MIILLAGLLPRQYEVIKHRYKEHTFIHWPTNITISKKILQSVDYIYLLTNFIRHWMFYFSKEVNRSSTILLSGGISSISRQIDSIKASPN